MNVLTRSRATAQYASFQLDKAPNRQDIVSLFKFNFIRSLREEEM